MPVLHLQGATAGGGHCLITIALLVACTMAVKDLLYTCCTAFIAKGRAGLASAFDTAGDIASVLTYGIGGVEAIKHGVSWYTLVIFAAMAVGSYLGTFGGVALSKWIEKRTGLPVSRTMRAGVK